MIALIVLGWVVCGVIGWGLTLGDFTTEFPAYKNWGIAAFIALTGPFGVFVSIIMNIIHHGQLNFRLKPLTKEERWDAFVKEGFGILGRDYFEREHG
jgi:hypothetical protein